MFLFGVVGCSKTPEDPGLTASASASAGTTDTVADSSGPDEDSDDSDDASDTAETATSTSGSDSSGEPDPTSGTSGGEPTTGTPSTTGPSGGCGDGVVSMGEQCDGDELNGFDCASLGLGGGTLACDPVTCSFDTSMCMSTSSGTSG